MVSQRNRLPVGVLVLGLLTCGLGACSDSSALEAGTGGKSSSGGTTASGGSGSGGVKGTGGTIGTGGTVASGGSVASGGTKGSGGVAQSGGTVGTGGSNSGGAKATGGTSSGSGGAATGGSQTGGAAAGASGRDGGTAGASGRDGAAAGGSAAGGAAAGGSGAGGSSTGGGTGSKTSPGCGSASPLKTSNSLSENINGTTRKWMLDVPTNYDTNKPYRLIFVWHPLGGNGSQIVSGGFNGLKSLSNSTAVFATADGLNGSNGEASGNGWWNAGGGDMKLFKAMLDKINAGLCIDQERIFTTGFSFGGMMSYELPFEFDVFRATAPCSGKTGVIPFVETYTNPVAIMAFHGDSDTFVATNLGKAFFDKFATRNKCGTQTQAVSPTGCVQYQGCTVPSIWCLFKGGHNTWSEEPAAIWKFFSQF